MTFEAASPGEVRRKGQGITIYYGRHPTVFGELFLAVTKKGVCWLGFEGGEQRKGSSLERIFEKWPKADFVQDSQQTSPHAYKINQIFEHGHSGTRIPLHVFGTNFQVQVWRALLDIPEGMTASYGDVASKIGKSGASRAVGSAVGENPVSLLIPCHRVIQSSGIVENYGWGDARKKFLLLREQRNLEEYTI